MGSRVGGRMRFETVLALGVLAVLTTVPASAQPGMDSDAAYLVRGALGNIPTTDATEEAGFWNQYEARRVQHDGTSTEVAFTVPAGAQDLGLTCNCNGSATRAGQTYTFMVDATEPAGPVEVVFTHRRAVSTDGFAFALSGIPADVRGDASLRFYVPDHFILEADIAPTGALESTPENPGLLIYFFDGTADSALPESLWFTAYPQTQSVSPPPADGGLDLLALLLGIAIGVVVWYFLVARGVVQARQRKQVVAKAEHQQVAEREPANVLEGRKRVLMAGLKELELAKASQQIETEVYDRLKAEYKKQTVTVMRALESTKQA